MKLALIILVVVKMSQSASPPNTEPPSTLPFTSTPQVTSPANTTSAAASGPPSAPRLHLRTTRTLTVTWTGDGVFYMVQHTYRGGLLANSLTNRTTNLTATIDGLTPGQSYDVRVIAYNGTSDVYGTAGPNTTMTTIPSAPLNVSFIPNERFITLEWDYTDGDVVKDFGVWCTPYINAFGDKEWNTVGKRFDRRFPFTNTYYGTQYNISLRAQSGAGDVSDVFSDNITGLVATEAAPVFITLSSDNRNSVGIGINLPPQSRYDHFRYYCNSTNGGRSNYSDVGFHYLTISDFEPGYSYTIYVVSFATYGAMSAPSNMLNYTAYPSPVVRVDLLNSTSSSLTFTWNFTGRYDSFNYSFLPPVPNSQGSLINTSGVYSLTYSNLSAGLSYTFKVRTRVVDLARTNRYKDSLFTTITRFTDEIEPSPVPNLDITNTTDASISISWESPEQENGVVIGYVLQATLANGTNNRCVRSVFFNCTDCQRKAFDYDAKVNSLTNQCDIADSSVDFSSSSSFSYTFVGLMIYTRYEIKVFAINTKEPSVEYISGLTVPNDGPDVTVEFVTHNSITITWSRVSDTYGTVLGYHVSAVEASTGLVTVSAEIPSTSSLKYVITLLTPYTKYHIYVLAFTREGNGTSRNDITATTSQYSPGAPSELVVEPDARSLSINWKEPNIKNGVIQSYNIRVDNSTHTVYNMNTSERAVTVSAGIRPYTAYTVIVRAKTVYPEWGAASSGHFKTPQTNPEGAPENFRNVSQNSSSVTLRWKEIREELRNGVIKGYTLSYNATSQITTKKLGQYETELTVTNLSRQTLYKFSLRGYTIIGYWMSQGPNATIYVMTTDIECSQAPTIPNTEATSKLSRTKNSTIRYKCKEGYLVGGGDSSLSCIEVDGEAIWKGELLSCKHQTSKGTVAAVVIVSVCILIAIAIAVVFAVRTYKKTWNPVNADSDMLPLSVAADFGDPQASPTTS